METKQCNQCKQEKPVEEFHRDSRTRDGRSSRCADCRRASSREWWSKDRDARAAVDRAYYEQNRERLIAKQTERNAKALDVRGNEIREQRAIYMRGWRAKNIERQKDYELRSRNGVTLAAYDELSEQQGGVCWICGELPASRDKYLCVDHCHNTGKIRGLLCKPCNRGLGAFRDDPARLLNAVRYLEK